MSGTFKDFEENLKDVQLMKNEATRRSMQYHAGLKERWAREYGLPYWAFYHIPFVDLERLRYFEDKEGSLEWWEANKVKGEEEEFEGMMSSFSGEATEEQVEVFKKEWKERHGIDSVSEVPSPAGT